VIHLRNEAQCLAVSIAIQSDNGARPHVDIFMAHGPAAVKEKFEGMGGKKDFTRISEICCQFCFAVADPGLPPSVLGHGRWVQAQDIDVLYMRENMLQFAIPFNRDDPVRANRLYFCDFEGFFGLIVNEAGCIGQEKNLGQIPGKGRFADIRGTEEKNGSLSGNDSAPKLSPLVRDNDF
jgi:hypothetical protein